MLESPVLRYLAAINVKLLFEGSFRPSIKGIRRYCESMQRRLDTIKRSRRRRMYFASAHLESLL